ncbi:Pleckstrin homology domain-containing protein [Fusarium oxysporum f. sp. albedinis]|nr:Pleckstrin homology domain-containing protein [Fusarium oxysporum f. sp. albedinis]
MAEEQKNVEVPQETKPETTPAPVTETPAESAPTTEAKPVEEGHLGHKDQGFSFPKSLIASKEFFFFGTDAFEPKALAHYLKTENLADATEPETDGSHKFHFTSKGNKHSFKAANTAERDNWVAQLKLKIAEAKELASTVTESEAYKKTIESFKPAPPKKEEAKAEESVSAPATEETPKEAKAEESVSAPATEEIPKEAKAEDLENQLKDIKDMSTKMDKNMEALMGMFEEFMKASAVTSEAAK